VNEYEMKQERRRERLENAAERAKRESDAAFRRSHDLVAGIPLGQPILVGHHSERRHRNAIDKSWNAMGRGVEAAKRAEELARRAESVGSAGISSDDPDAVDKLREKLEGLKARQENMKAANKIVRAFYKAGVRDPDSGELWTRYVAKMTEAGLGDPESLASIKPDFCGRIGFPDYALQNNNANIRRVEGRIAELAQRAKVVAALEAEGAAPVEVAIGAARIVENVAANRLQVFFPGKPAAEVRTQLKRGGFRWAPSEGAWQRHLSSGARYAAEQILKGVASG
jgi:hypothetical protein